MQEKKGINFNDIFQLFNTNNALLISANPYFQG